MMAVISLLLKVVRNMFKFEQVVRKYDSDENGDRETDSKGTLEFSGVFFKSIQVNPFPNDNFYTLPN